MQITWLFGNGLDLSFGLKTSYKDFYEFLLKKNLQDNIIFSQLKIDYQNHQEDLWSDYEIRLGQLTSIISDDQLDKYEENKVDIDLLLKEYLAEENQKIDLEDQNNIILNSSFSELERCTRQVDKDKLSKLMSNHSNTALHIKAVSFNYTDTVSLLWGSNPDIISNFKIYGYPSSYHCLLENPFYLHGTLDDGEMIIGINDSAQIDSEKFRNNANLQSYLIKSNLLESAGQLHIERFIGIINNSELICTYGLSLGSTDSAYWEVIKKRLLTSDSILIIYHYNSSYTNTHISLTTNYIREVKKVFYKHSNATNDEIEKLDKQIIVEINHILFKK